MIWLIPIAAAVLFWPRDSRAAPAPAPVQDWGGEWNDPYVAPVAPVIDWSLPEYGGEWNDPYVAPAPYWWELEQQIAPEPVTPDPAYWWNLPPVVQQPEPQAPPQYQPPIWSAPLPNDPAANIAAFLTVIRHGEGTADSGGYNRLMGGGAFSDMSDHPANLGWKGTPLSDAYCRAANINPPCFSTAAGAYQILVKSWADFIRSVGPRDFSRESQDEYALWAIDRKRGALRDVEAGRFTDAIRKTAKEWASLPYSPYGQPTISIARAKQIYADNGGTLIA